MTSIDPNLKIGQMIDSYRILRFIGRGGMGEVYEAEDNTLNRKVALKVMLPHLMGDSNFVMRFLAEGKSLAKINHRNVVTVYALDVTDGIYYMAMELIEGQTLDEVISKSRLSDRQIFSYLRQILAGVNALHTNQIIHRDLKPKNMIVNKDNVLKIVDFGIAKMKFGERELTTAAAGTVIGSINYIAPEVLRGQDASESSDLWSVGVILYEMLYGEKLFSGHKPLAVMDEIKSDEIVRLPFGRRMATPKFMTDILKKLLEKSPYSRPASARALLSEFTMTDNTGEPTLPETPMSLSAAKFENSNLSAADVASTGSIKQKSSHGAAAIVLGVFCVVALGFYSKMKNESKTSPLEMVSAPVEVAVQPVQQQPPQPVSPPPQFAPLPAPVISAPQVQQPVISTPVPPKAAVVKYLPKKSKPKTVARHVPAPKNIIASVPLERQVASVPPVSVPKLAPPELAPPKLNLPQEGIVIMAPDANPVPIVFKWESTDGADAYQIELSPTKDFSNIVFTKKTRENQLVVRTTLPIGNVYWRVRAKKVRVVSPWSDSANFEISKP